MLVAIDIDGTLTAYPDVFRTMAGVLRQAGHPVVLLTGATDPRCQPGFVHDPPNRLAQVTPLLGGLVLPIVEVHGRDGPENARLKGEYCRDNQVALFVDDDPGFCDFVRHLSPDTCCLRACS